MASIDDSSSNPPTESATSSEAENNDPPTTGSKSEEYFKITSVVVDHSKINPTEKLGKNQIAQETDLLSLLQSINGVPFAALSVKDLCAFLVKNNDRIRGLSKSSKIAVCEAIAEARTHYDKEIAAGKSPCKVDHT